MKKLSVSATAALFVAELTLFFGFMFLANKNNYFFILAGVFIVLGASTVYSLTKKIGNVFDNFYQSLRSHIENNFEKNISESSERFINTINLNNENMLSKIDMLADLQNNLLTENANMCKAFENELEQINKMNSSVLSSIEQKTDNLINEFNKDFNKNANLLNSAIQIMHSESQNTVNNLKEETLKLMKQQSESMKSNYTDAYSKLIESIEFLTEEYKKIIEDGIDGYQEGQKEWNTDIEEIIGEALDDYKKELNKQNRTLEELSYMVKNSTESYNNTLDLIKNNQESMNNLTAKDIKLIERLMKAK